MDENDNKQPSHQAVAGRSLEFHSGPCEFDPTPTFAVLSRFIHRFDLRRLTYNWNMITILAVLIYFLFCNIIASLGCFVS